MIELAAVAGPLFIVMFVLVMVIDQARIKARETEDPRLTHAKRVWAMEKDVGLEITPFLGFTPPEPSQSPRSTQSPYYHRHYPRLGAEAYLNDIDRAKKVIEERIERSRRINAGLQQKIEEKLRNQIQVENPDEVSPWWLLDKKREEWEDFPNR